MKNKWLKRTMAAVLTGVLLLGTLTGCGGGTSDSEDLKLSWYANVNLGLQTSYTTAEDSPFHSGLSEMTGIDIEWQFPAAGVDSAASYNLTLQSEKLPNIMSGSVFDSTEATELMNDGIIVDLTDYIPKYAPDYWAYLQANPDDYKSVLTADGKIYGFGAFAEEEYNIVYLGPVIRKDWLDECGLEEPETLEDWENVLVTFKQKYGAVFSFSLSRFNWAGISSGTGAFAPLTDKYYLDENQKVQFANAQVEWKEMLETLNRWYDMNLIDKDFATNSDSDVRAKVLRNEVGVSFTAMSQMTAWIEDAEEQNTGAEWMGISYPRESAGAPVKYNYTTANNRNANNAAVITTSCSEAQIIAACKLLNYGYTEDGILYWNYGQEGVSYVLDADGNPQFTELVTEDPLGMTEACQKYTGTHSAGISIQLRSYVEAKYAVEASEAVEKWISNSTAKKYVLPSTPKNEDVLAEYNDAVSMISTYVKEMALKFVTGEESLSDSNWNKYLKQLESYGLSRVLEIEQEAYENYMAN